MNPSNDNGFISLSLGEGRGEVTLTPQGFQIFSRTTVIKTMPHESNLCSIAP